MLKNIFTTIISKSITSISNFLVVMLTAYFLGAATRGEMAIIVMGLSIINLFQGIVGGSALVYLTPRHHFTSLLLSGYLWSVLMAAAIGPLMVMFNLYPENYLFDLIILSLLQGLLSTNTMLLLGKQKIKHQNILEIIKSCSLVVFILLQFFVFKTMKLEVIIHAMYVSTLLPLIFSLLFIRNYILFPSQTNLSVIINDFFKHGLVIQLNQISQLFNYRFCFYLIDKFHGKAALGIFSVAISIAETAWIICRSIASIQYASIANSKNENYNQKISIVLSKISLAISMIAVALLLLLPEQVYSYVFGNEFTTVKPIMLSLAPATCFLAFFTILNHYFAGTGKNHINVQGAIIGNISLIAFGLWLIPSGGNIGAGIANSIAYFLMLLFILWRFVDSNKLQYRSFLPNKNDINQALELLKSKALPK